MRAVEHQAGNIFDRKPGSQVRRPLCCGQSPVLIGRQLACSEKILEGEAILCYNRHLTAERDSEILSPLIVNETVALLLCFVPFFLH